MNAEGKSKIRYWAGPMPIEIRMKMVTKRNGKEFNLPQGLNARTEQLHRQKMGYIPRCAKGNPS